MNRDGTLFGQKDRRWRSAQYIAIIATAASISLPHRLNLAAIISLVVITIGCTPISSFILRVKEDRLLQLLIVFVTLYLVAAIRSESLQLFFSTLERKSMLFILPLIFTSVTLTRQEVNVVIKWFVISVAIAMVSSFVSLHADDIIINAYDFTHYFWQLSEHTIIPSNYLALYASFAVIILVHTWESEDLFKKPWTLILVIFFFLFIAVVGARMAFLLTVFMLAFRLVYLGAGSRYKVKMAPILLLVVVGICTVGFTPYLKDKFSSLLSAKDPRYFEFKAAINVIEMKPVFGHGIQQAETEMLKEYEKMGFQEGILNIFNAHNEYLETTIIMGSVGLAVLLVILSILIKRALESRDFIVITFALLFCVAASTESLLTRNKGIVLFGFFTGLFLLLNKSNENKV